MVDGNSDASATCCEVQGESALTLDDVELEPGASSAALASTTMDPTSFGVIDPLLVSYPSTSSTYAVESKLRIETIGRLECIVVLFCLYMNIAVIGPFSCLLLSAEQIRGAFGCRLYYRVLFSLFVILVPGFISFVWLTHTRKGRQLQRWQPEQLLVAVQLLLNIVSVVPWCSSRVMANEEVCFDGWLSPFEFNPVCPCDVFNRTSAGMIFAEYAKFDYPSGFTYALHYLEDYVGEGDWTHFSDVYSVLWCTHYLIVSVQLVWVKLFQLDPGSSGNTRMITLYCLLVVLPLTIARLFTIEWPRSYGLEYEFSSAIIEDYNQWQIVDYTVMLVFVIEFFRSARHLERSSYMRYRHRQISFYVVILPIVVGMVFSTGVSLANMESSDNNLMGGIIGLPVFTLFAASITLPPAQDGSIRAGMRIFRREKSLRSETTSSEQSRNGAGSHDGSEHGGTGSGLLVLETALTSFNSSKLVYHDPPPLDNFDEASGVASRAMNSKDSTDDSAGTDHPCRSVSLRTTSGFGFMDTRLLHVCHLKVLHFVYHRESDTTACLFADIHRPWRLFLSFRGTASVRNVKTDAKAFQTRCNLFDPTLSSAGEGISTFTPQRVHAGFLNAYNAVKAKVRAALRSELEKLRLTSGRPPTVGFTGHSLGGALATLAAANNVRWLRQEQLVRRITLYTFGSPTVGDHNFVRSLNAEVPHTIRFVADGDIITAPRQITTLVGLLASVCNGGGTLVGRLCKRKSKARRLPRNAKKSHLCWYEHAGTEVVLDLTERGDMIIRPTISEKIFSLKMKTHPESHLLSTYRRTLVASIRNARGDDAEENADSGAHRLHCRKQSSEKQLDVILSTISHREAGGREDDGLLFRGRAHSQSAITYV